MPRFCANISFLFREHAPLDRVAAAMAAGFSGVEVQFPQADGTAAQWRRAVESAGAGVGVINVPVGDLLDGGPGLAITRDRQQAFRSGVEQTRDYAEAMRPHAVNVIAGPPPDGANLEECKRVFAENLQYAAETFAAVGVKVVTEPMNPVDRPGWMVLGLAAAVEAVERAAHPNLGIEFDLYHMSITEPDALAALRREIGRIHHIQFADVPGRHEPGTGQIDFPAIWRALDELQYPGWVGAEYLPSKPTVETLAWLKAAQG